MKKTAKIIVVLILIILSISSCNKNKTSSLTKPKHTLSTLKIVDTNLVLPPAWAFGYIYGTYANQKQSIDLINRIIEHDYPIDAFWIDSWIWDWQNQGEGPKKYMDFVADTISYPDMNSMWDFMKEKNIKSGMWVWDCILRTGNEKAYEDFKSKGFFKSEYINTNSWHNGSRTTIMDDKSQPVDGTWCGNIDFENPEAVVYFKEKMAPFFENGLDFLKLDRTDAIPVVKTMFELSQEKGKETKGRGFVFSHSNGVNTEEYKRYPGKWTDDTRSDWSAFTHTRTFQPWIPKVGLKENIEMYTDLNRHYHKIPFLANDMGGFAVSEDGFIDEDLYIRWFEFATFIPLTTPFSQPENKSGNIAFNISKQADTIFRNYAHLKMKLFPYIYTYAHKSRIEGINTIRPIKGDLYTYFFGENFLVAPVYENGHYSREVIFPKGNSWINFWNNEEYEGGTKQIVNAPIHEIPLFVKKGAIIPMREYAKNIESGTNELIELHIFPGENGQFQLIEDDGTSNDYLEGFFSIINIELKNINSTSFKLIINPIQGSYTKMPKDRKWKVIIHDNKKYNEAIIGNQPLKLNKQNQQISSDIIIEDVSNKIEILVNL